MFKSELNLDQLTKELSECNERTALWSVVRAEVMKRGHWRAKRRGDPLKGLLAQREKYPDLKLAPLFKKEVNE